MGKNKRQSRIKRDSKRNTRRRKLRGGEALLKPLKQVLLESYGKNLENIRGAESDYLIQLRESSTAGLNLRPLKQEISGFVQAFMDTLLLHYMHDYKYIEEKIQDFKLLRDEITERKPKTFADLNVLMTRVHGIILTIPEDIMVKIE
jgi:hypothetical protein